MLSKTKQLRSEYHRSRARQLVKDLNKVDCNQQELARQMGCSRSYINELVQKYQIKITKTASCPADSE